MSSENLRTKKSVFLDREYWKRLSKIIPMNIMVLGMSAGGICVFPFMVLQMQLLGINIQQIAVIFLVTPVGAVAGPVIAGLIADKTGKYKLVLFCNILLFTLSLNLLLVVPKDERIVFLTCSPESEGALTYHPCRDCVMNLGTSEGQLTLESCLLQCPGNNKNTGNLSAAEPFCDEDNECPAFNSTQQVKIIVTNSSKTSSETCELDFYNNDTLKSCISNCTYKCIVKEDLNECRVDNMFSKTFIMFGSFLMLATFFVAASFTMVDASLLTFCKEQNLDLGKQKIISVFGFGLAPLLSGYVTDCYTNITGTVSYLPAFILSDIFFGIALLALLAVELKADLNESNIFKGVGKLIKRKEVDAFLLIVLILGINFGFIESYLFIFLKFLGASDFLLGITLTVGNLSSIPMLFYADWLQLKIGRQNVFLLCFTAYALRMIGYSFIINPWMCLLFELLEAFTYQLLWVTCLKLCPLLAPKGLLATMTGLAGSIHYSVGKGIGAFLGGYLIGGLGIRNAFRVFGGIALAGGVIYLIIHHLVLKKKIEIREREINEEKLRMNSLDETEELMKPLEQNNINKYLDDVSKDFSGSLNCLSPIGKVIYVKMETTSKNGTRSRRSLPHIFVPDVYKNVIIESKSETNLSP